MTATYRVTFDRIGRSRPEPETFEDVTDIDDLAHRIYKLGRRFLGSREMSVAVDLESMSGYFLAGPRPGGDFSIEELVP